MNERMQFVGMYLEHELGMASLCRHFGISRKTGYKWVSRYVEAGVEGLGERSRAPQSHRHAVSEQCVEAVLAARAAPSASRPPDRTAGDASHPEPVEG